MRIRRHGRISCRPTWPFAHPAFSRVLGCFSTTDFASRQSCLHVFGREWLPWKGMSWIIPLDLQLPTILSQPNVAFHLLPLSGGASKAPSMAKASNPKKRSRSPRKQQPVKGKGWPKGRSGKNRGPIPAGLINKALETPQKQRLCWAYNLPNCCSKAKAGESYSKGIHLCAEPGCFKPRSLQDHRWSDPSFTHGWSFSGQQISQVFAARLQHPL